MSRILIPLLAAPVLLGGVLLAEAALPPAEIGSSLRDAVETRLRDDADTMPRRTFKRLNRAFRILDGAPAGFADAGKSLGKASRQVERGVAAEDPLLGTAGAAVDDLAEAAGDQWDAVAARVDAMEDGRPTRKASRLVDRSSNLLAAAAAETAASRRARRLSRACRLLERVDRIAPPLPDPVADIGLVDLNPTSPTYEETVSPRDHLGGVSAWYFGHST